MTIAVSAFVSLTLTPMMAARLLKAHDAERHGRLYRMSEAGFDWLLSVYEDALDVALRFRQITLLVFFATLALTVYLFVAIPKGFFPQQDTGFMIGVTEAGQDISFSAMMKLQEKVGAIVPGRPGGGHGRHVARRATARR